MILKDAVAIVTGGASGIGRAITTMLVERGAKVVIVDVTAIEGKKFARELNKRYAMVDCARFMLLDVSSKDLLEEMFKRVIADYGHLDILCNNAGVIDEQQWKRMIEINLCAVIQGTLFGIDYMNGGVIINTSSTGGLQPVSHLPMYCSTKFGIVGFTRSIAPSAYRRKGIRVNCICPGSTETNILQNMRVNVELSDERHKAMKNGPAQSPIEVARCVVDLIVDDTMVGQVVKINPNEGIRFVEFQEAVI